MKTIQAFQKAIEPIVDVVLAIEKRLNEFIAGSPVGPAGPAGPAGKDGSAPTPEDVSSVLIEKCSDVLKGADGKDGRDGQDGACGAAGKDGSDADPEDVAAVLVLQHSEVLRGASGRDGSDGCDGAGINSSQYVESAVYREGSIVQAFIGRYYIAQKDTAGAPEASDDWFRIGSSGFRPQGAYDPEKTYQTGDLFTRDFSTWLVCEGKEILFGARGAKGERGIKGEDGKRGENGRDGKDGSIIIASEVTGFVASLVVRNGDGEVDTVSWDFTKAFQEYIDIALRKALEDYEIQL